MGKDFHFDQYLIREKESPGMAREEQVQCLYFSLTGTNVKLSSPNLDRMQEERRMLAIILKGQNEGVNHCI